MCILSSAVPARSGSRARRDRGHTSSQMFLNSFAREFCTTLLFCIFHHYTTVPDDAYHSMKYINGSACSSPPSLRASRVDPLTHRPRPRSRHRSSRPDASVQPSSQSSPHRPLAPPARRARAGASASLASAIFFVAAFASTSRDSSNLALISSIDARSARSSPANAPARARAGVLDTPPPPKT